MIMFLTIILSTILVAVVVSVIGLIFYPEIKEAFTITIPENVQQIQDDLTENDELEDVLEEEIEMGSGSGEASNETN